jgi:cysteine desulfurase
MPEPVYFDCNATTPVDPRVVEEVSRYFLEEYGNAGSRSHEFGLRARKAVQLARRSVGDVVDASAEEVIFTSGATESNNLAILGLARHGESTGRRHIISTRIEHKAVLEPLEHLQSRGFEISYAPVGASGAVDPDDIVKLLRPDTLAVSVMHANNETGVVQPIAEVADALGDHPAFLHVDAAQGFGKDLTPLRCNRTDLLSVSGHKLFAPKGVGALIARRRGFARPPLSPLMFGGGQEFGLRPGTVPVALVAGLALAAELAVREHLDRRRHCIAMRSAVLSVFRDLGGELNGDPTLMLPHVLNVSVPGVDSEALLVALKPFLAFSNGSACTSASYKPSHVLVGMGLAEDRVRSAVRLSWYHATPTPDWHGVQAAVRGLM